MATTQALSLDDFTAKPLGSGLSWRVLLVGVALALAHVPLLIMHLTQIWLRPHYQFFPLVFLGAGVLAVTRSRGLGSLSPGSSRRSYALLGVAWATLAGAVLLYSSWLGAVATLLMLAAVLYALGGGRLFRQMLPAWLLLWLVVPPPFELDRGLILALQTLASDWSSSVLDQLGVFHVMAGNVVEVQGRRLLVEESCAGINSLFSVTALTVFFVLLARRPPIWAVLVIAAALGWVLAANVARITGVVYAATRCEIDLSEGWRHDVLGVIVFAAALLMIWSTDRFFLFLTAPGKLPVNCAPPVQEKAGPSSRTRLPDVRKTLLGNMGVAVAYGLLAVLWLASYGLSAAESMPTASRVSGWLESLDATAVPENVGPWRRHEFDVKTRNPGSAFGEQSRVWTYRCGQNLAVLSLDYSFPCWHDLTRCYTAQGWTVDEQITFPEQALKGNVKVGFVEAQLSRPGYRSGYLLFCQLTDNGEFLQPRRGGAELSVHRHQSILRRWWDSLNGVSRSPAGDPPGPIYQVQLFIESYSPLSPAEKTKARNVFLEGTAALCKKWPRDTGVD
jgi:exosortase